MKKIKFKRFAKVSLFVYSILLASCGANNLNNRNKQMNKSAQQNKKQKKENENLQKDKPQKFVSKEDYPPLAKFYSGYFREIEKYQFKPIPDVIKEIIINYHFNMSRRFEDYKKGDDIILLCKKRDGFLPTLSYVPFISKKDNKINYTYRNTRERFYIAEINYKYVNYKKYNNHKFKRGDIVCFEIRKSNTSKYGVFTFEFPKRKLVDFLIVEKSKYPPQKDTISLEYALDYNGYELTLIDLDIPKFF